MADGPCEKWNRGKAPRLEPVIARKVNLACQRNAVPVIRELVVENRAGESFSDLLLKVEADPPFFQPRQWHIDRLLPDSLFHVRDVSLKLSGSYLEGLTEALPGTMRFTLLSEGDELCSRQEPVELLARDEWGGLAELPEIIAAFVLPNAPQVEQLLREASGRLGAAGQTTSLEGYQSGSPRRVATIVSAIWSAVCAQGIAYSVPPASFETRGQKIRSPARILESRLATCLDLSVLFAACLEQAGLHPLIIFAEDHAFTGCWLQDLDFAHVVEDDFQALRKRVQLGELLVFEPTLAAHSPPGSFVFARKEAERRLEDDAAARLAVDIHRARMARILPLAFPVAPGPEAGAAPARATAPGPAAGLEIPEDIPEEAVEEAPAPAEAGPPAGRVEHWLRKLLDLSLRNSLLNFRAGRKALPVVCPDPGRLEDLLADGRKFGFRPFSGESLKGKGGAGRSTGLHRELTEEDLLQEYASRALERGDLLVNMDPGRLEATLTGLFRAARNAEEEGGSNILHLAVGFLVWNQKGKSDRQLRAPLILIPVRLRRKSVRSGFRLVLHEDEPRFNPTLLEMLRQDFSLRIPELEGDLPTDDHGLDVAGIWEHVRRAVRDIRGWEVVEDVVLSTFSFVKYLMWKDLGDRTGQLKQNPLVRHLIENPREPYVEQAGEWFPDPASLDDRWHPSRIYCPLPADSSQLAAVLAAAEGKDFVLIGPPGTGKSQTIANMISQCLAEGKTVLFVSEKTAALDVVYRRLRQIGLDTFCLELHSARARKLEVLRQLGEAWEASERMSKKEWEREAERLDRLRKQLNRHVHHLHRVHANGWTVFRAIGEVVNHREVPEVTFTWPSPDIHTREEYERLLDLARRIDQYRKQVGGFHDNPLRGIARGEWTPSWQQEFLDALRELASACVALQGAAQGLLTALGLPPLPLTSGGLRALTRLGMKLKEAGGTGWGRILREGGRQRLDAVRRALRLLDDYSMEWEALSVPYRREATGADLDAISRLWQEAARSWWGRRFLLKYRVKRRLRSLTTEGVAPRHPGEDLAHLVGAREAEERLNKLSPFLAEALGPIWAGLDTATGELERLIAWAEDVRDAIRSLAGEPGQLQALRRQVHLVTTEGNELLEPGGAVALAADALRRACNRFEEVLESVGRLAGVESVGEPESSRFLDTVRDECSSWLESASSLRYWCAWQALRGEGLGLGLEPLIALVESQEPSVATEVLFRVNYCRWWVSAMVEVDEVLRNFVPAEYEDCVRQFRQLDQQVMEITGRYVRARLCGRIPSRAAAGTGGKRSEWGILQRELNKKRRHMPVRQLMERMSGTLSRLTPCVMMSPLSIAQYLPADSSLFDVVIFDEASQIPTWDAVGAIARGRQAIIVGDPKQLPPTSFFQRGPDEADDEDLEIEDLESILDECLGANVPSHQLTWHYRSRDESLIAFSNARYYGGRLVTFPSPCTREDALFFHEVPEGCYEKGGARVNREEAGSLVRWLIGRLRRPDFHDSVGIVTFNSQQQRLIQDLLDQERRADPQIEPHFDETGSEPVFVKNLESVQGDERDIILFSVTYGPDRTGHVSVNLGPLNREGGQRRLNVAVTRARKEMHVFSTLLPGRIDLNRTNAEGVRDLKDFLEYVQRGPRALAEAITPPRGDFESPFEAAVAAALAGKGWVVHSQIGVSAFRIDLGIVHPELPGRYLAGIECDGATYHRSRTARDRDLLREEILRNLGWEILRVWSMDWWTDPAAALEKLHEGLTRLLEREAGQEERTEGTGAGDAGEIAGSAGEAEEVRRETANGHRATQQPELAVDSSPRPEPDGRPDHDDSRGDVPAVTQSPPSPDDGTRAAAGHGDDGAERKAKDGTREQNDFTDPAKVDELRRTIVRIVNEEGPLRSDRLAHLTAERYGYRRAGRKIHARVMELAGETCPFTREGGHVFVWPENSDPATWDQYREPPPGRSRIVDEMPEQELMVLARQVVSEGRRGEAGLERMAGRLGLKRIRKRTRERLARILEIAVCEQE